jgi:hypothetical protein
VSEKPRDDGMGPTTGAAARSGPRGRPSQLWRKPGFAKLWAGQSVSLLGSSVTTLALPLTAIYTLHADAAQALVASFVVSSTSLLWIRKTEPTPNRPQGKTSVPAQIRAGLSVVFSNMLRGR